jgi:hypothetical protein
MLFESEKKALNFIKYNNLDILEESGRRLRESITVTFAVDII